jgi:hypothetical protein
VIGTASADDEAARTVTATCGVGKVVVGGGFITSGAGTPGQIVITANYPSSTTVWTVAGTVDSNAGDASYALRAYAICVTTP